MKILRPSDIKAFREEGSWRTLERLAQEMVTDAQKKAGLEFRPLLGGGTRIMLSLEHRVSHDVDLFIRDPQWIGYLTPRLNDTFESQFTKYEEGAVSLKLRHAVGEIDFIVAMSLLGLPNEHSEDTTFELEPLAEVLAKKLFYRGWALTPRDLFDWWVIETRVPEAIPHQQMADLLKARLPEISNALAGLGRTEKTQIAWDSIIANDKPDLSATISWAQSQVQWLSDLAEHDSKPDVSHGEPGR